MLTTLLLIVDACFLGMTLYFTFESVREREYRAPKVGLGIMAFLGILAVVILWVPMARPLVGALFGLGLLFGLVFLIPGTPDPKALQGAGGYVVGEAQRADERDVSFARLRIQPKGSEPYRRYYQKHPQKEAPDAKRRAKGMLGRLGNIDDAYAPNVAMIHAAFDIPPYLGLHARNEPSEEAPAVELSPEKASLIIKDFARHLGADLVGICRVDPNWVYSHRGEIHYDNWEQWGDEITDVPPYAIVLATEMTESNVRSAPHTPTTIESAVDYAKGAYLGTLIARWLAHMGYRGVAQNTRNYDVVLPPLAVDAGLGEVGRLGYLIAPKMGARVRVFAVLTDMPLVVDDPISIGVDEFCNRCKKCAEACPSHSIPLDAKTVHRGAEKWKLDDDSCYDYWSKVGTDCSICMAICPFSRPNTWLHIIIRWVVARSPLAQKIFPYIDNFLYGRKWHPKTSPAWIDYSRANRPKGS